MSTRRLLEGVCAALRNHEEDLLHALLTGDRRCEHCHAVMPAPQGRPLAKPQVVRKADTYTVNVGGWHEGAWVIGVHGTADECAAQAHLYARAMVNLRDG